MSDECVFCEIIAGRAPGIMPTRWDDAAVIEPLNPVTKGHVLVVPRQHVADAAEHSVVTAAVMGRAAQYLQLGPYPDTQPIGPANIITSCGAEATQTVFHLHVHIVPRREGDGLALPWDGILRAEYETLRVNAARSGAYWQNRAIAAEATRE